MHTSNKTQKAAFTLVDLFIGLAMLGVVFLIFLSVDQYRHGKDEKKVEKTMSGTFFGMKSARANVGERIAIQKIGDNTVELVFAGITVKDGIPYAMLGYKSYTSTDVVFSTTLSLVAAGNSITFAPKPDGDSKFATKVKIVEIGATYIIVDIDGEEFPEPKLE